MITETTSFLGPCRVLEVGDPGVLVELPNGPVWAVSAVAAHYRPARHDLVLVIGSERGHFVIGVIRGTGRTVLMGPADIDLIAANGAINLVATRGVSIRSTTIKLQATRVEVLARSLFEKLENAYCWVKESLHVKAASVRTSVKENYHLKARRIVETAKQDVTLDGEKINLG